MGEACYGCVKYVMFAFNFLFMVLGCVLLGLGLWVRFDDSFRTYTDNFKSLMLLESSHYILICVGLAVMVIGFFGCCGALRESQCMMIVFFCFLLIIFATLIGLSVWALVSKDSLKDTVHDVIRKAVRNYKDHKEFVDTIQTKLKCCGASGATDYIIDLNTPTCNILYINTGCSSKVFQFFSQQILIIASVSICIGVITLLGMVFSILMCTMSKNAVYT